MKFQPAMRRRPFRSLFDRPLRPALYRNGNACSIQRVAAASGGSRDDRIPIGRQIAARANRLSVRIRDVHSDEVVSRDTLFRVIE